jgi:hypothetical protein
VFPLLMVCHTVSEIVTVLVLSLWAFLKSEICQHCVSVFLQFVSALVIIVLSYLKAILEVTYNERFKRDIILKEFRNSEICEEYRCYSSVSKHNSSCYQCFRSVHKDITN